MKILGIDTTRKKARLFVFDFNNGSKYEVVMPENIKHSDGLFLYIEKCLLDNGLSLDDFDKFAVVVGPGSFTGIRVGMSTIKGFDKVKCKGVIALNSFEILSEAIKSGYIVLNSTATSCYYAKIKNHKIDDAGVINKTDIVKEFNDAEILILEEEQELIGIEYNNIKVIDNVLEFYYQAINKKIDSENYGDVVPYYLQLSQAERNFKSE